MAKSSSAAKTTTVVLTGDQRRQLKAEAKRGLQLILLMADIASANPKTSANALATNLAEEFGLVRSYLNNAQKWAKDAALALGVALSDLRATVESQPGRFKTQKDLLDLSKADADDEATDADADADADDAADEAADTTPAATFAKAVAEAIKAGMSEAAMVAAIKTAFKAQAGLKKTG
jgi:hypothetical protein